MYVKILNRLSVGFFFKHSTRSVFWGKVIIVSSKERKCHNFSFSFNEKKTFLYLLSSVHLYFTEWDCSGKVHDDNYQKLPLKSEEPGVEEGNGTTQTLHELEYCKSCCRFFFECSSKNWGDLKILSNRLLYTTIKKTWVLKQESENPRMKAVKTARYWFDVIYAWSDGSVSPMLELKGKLMNIRK